MYKIRVLKPDEKLIIVFPADATQEELDAAQLLLSNAPKFVIASEQYGFYIIPKGGTVEVEKK